MAAEPHKPSILTFPPRPEWGSAAHRRAVGEYVRKCREHAGVSRVAAANHIRTSPATYGRLEKGMAPLRQRDIDDLALLYGVHDAAELRRVSELVAEAARPAPWQQYSDMVVSWFRPLLSLEPAAELIHSYEPQLVPGWLQTEEYAQIVTRAGHPLASQAWVDRRCALRKGRFDMFRRAVDPPALLAIMDETVLNRPVGSPGVMFRQIHHLLKLLEQYPYELNLQIAPLSMGAIGAVGHAIVHLRFRHSLLPDAVYLEQCESASYTEYESETKGHQARLVNLSMTAAGEEQTRELLLEALEKYR
ncbi:helix-turn-helix domain-containing protein [Streptomyces celluloflavus]|uniref:helix-turn-helix domain-containing protein n=1 Tax=Streptomyces celluloflavus TaxID=58344 RepID=UPI0036BDB497